MKTVVFTPVIPSSRRLKEGEAIPFGEPIPIGNLDSHDTSPFYVLPGIAAHIGSRRDCVLVSNIATGGILSVRDQRKENPDWITSIQTSVYLFIPLRGIEESPVDIYTKKAGSQEIQIGRVFIEEVAPQKRI